MKKLCKTETASMNEGHAILMRLSIGKGKCAPRVCCNASTDTELSTKAMAFGASYFVTLSQVTKFNVPFMYLATSGASSALQPNLQAKSQVSAFLQLTGADTTLTRPVYTIYRVWLACLMGVKASQSDRYYNALHTCDLCDSSSNHLQSGVFLRLQRAFSRIIAECIGSHKQVLPIIGRVGW